MRGGVWETELSKWVLPDFTFTAEAEVKDRSSMSKVIILTLGNSHVTILFLLIKRKNVKKLSVGPASTWSAFSLPVSGNLRSLPCLTS